MLPSSILIFVALQVFATCTDFAAAGVSGNAQDVAQTPSIRFDCETRLPFGRSKSEAETTSLPPISVIIGSSVLGQIKYILGVALPIRVSYGGSQCSAIFIKAETVFGSKPVGHWTTTSTGVSPFTCSSDSDSIIGTSLGKAGSFDLFWTPSDTTDYVEIQNNGC